MEILIEMNIDKIAKSQLTAREFAHSTGMQLRNAICMPRASINHKYSKMEIANSHSKL